MSDFLPPERSSHQPSSSESRAELVEKIRQALEQLGQYEQLISIYRPELNRIRDLRQEYADRITKALETDPSSVNQILLELQRFGRISKAENLLQQERQRIDSQPMEKVADNIKAEGFEERSNERRVVSPTEIIDEIIKVIPPDLLNNLKKLKYIPATDDAENVETIGSFRPTFGVDEEWDQIENAEIEIYMDLFVPAEASRSEQDVAKNEFMNTLWHEFGHDAQYTLDYDEMVSWEKVVDEDEVAITWYVKYSRAQHIAEGKREDFAESFKLFLHNPALLLALSPNRHRYMKAYFDRHLHEQQKEPFMRRLADQLTTTFAAWRKLGHSIEDVKRIFLDNSSL